MCIAIPKDDRERAHNIMNGTMLLACHVFQIAPVVLLLLPASNLVAVVAYTKRAAYDAQMWQAVSRRIHSPQLRETGTAQAASRSKSL